MNFLLEEKLNRQNLNKKVLKIPAKGRNKKRKHPYYSEALARLADASSYKNPSPVTIDDALASYHSGEFELAARKARGLISSFPTHPIGWKLLGAIFISTGNISSALEPMLQSVKLSTNDPSAYNNLGITLKELGRLNEAEESYREAIRLCPDYAEVHSNLGLLLLDLAKLSDAEASCREAVRLKPDFPQAHFNLGVVLVTLGRFSDAGASYVESIRLKPDFTEAYYNLANTLKTIGRLGEAEENYRYTIRLKPDFYDAYLNLGVTLEALGRPHDALASYQELIRLKPDCARAHYNAGSILADFGNPTHAAIFFRNAIRLEPDYFDAHLSLGNVLRELELFSEAEKIYQEAIRIRPNSAQVYSNLGNLLKDQRRFDDAELSYRFSIRLQPDFALAHFNLGNLLTDLDRLTDAVSSYEVAIRLQPHSAKFYNNLGIVQRHLQKLRESEQSYRKALTLDPTLAESHMNLGVVLYDLGQFDEAEQSYQEAIRLKPDFLEARSNLLFSFNARGQLLVDTLLVNAKGYGHLSSARAVPKFTSWLTTDQTSTLKLGFVSGDFRNHPVGYFFEGLLKYLDKSRFEVFVFPTHPKNDEFTDRLKSYFTHWIPIYEKSDRDASSLIYSYGIHILFDLSGHTACNRLPVFSFRPAPIQVSWLGYFATTGLPEIDYLLGDPFVTPNEESHHFSERIWQMPESYLCFTPPLEDVTVEPLPALNNGYVTFGCFNNLTKVSAPVVALWSRILHELPTAKLFLKTKQLIDPEARQRIIKQFADFNIAPERLILEDPSPRGGLLAAYNKVDIALDPFPYPGGATSAEALWMGVPVLTLKGDRFLSHVGETIAHNSGQSDWIAQSHDDYVSKAIAHAADPDQLDKLRQSLRKKVLQSALFDAPRFAKHFERALQQMWTCR